MSIKCHIKCLYSLLNLTEMTLAFLSGIYETEGSIFVFAFASDVKNNIVNETKLNTYNYIIWIFYFAFEM